MYCENGANIFLPSCMYSLPRKISTLLSSPAVASLAKTLGQYAEYSHFCMKILDKSGKILTVFTALILIHNIMMMI